MCRVYEECSFLRTKENWNKRKYRIEPEDSNCGVWVVSLYTRRKNDRKFHLYNGLATGPSIKSWCESEYHIQEAHGNTSYAQQVLHKKYFFGKALLWKRDLSIVICFWVSDWKSITNKISQNSWLLDKCIYVLVAIFWIMCYEWISFFLLLPYVSLYFVMSVHYLVNQCFN